jgi:hypothetical protein
LSELRLLELLIFFLLLLPVISPFVKNLEKLRGLVWLYFITLVIIAAIFPAYGFRPECIPLLIAALFLNIFSFLRFLSKFRKQNRAAPSKKLKITSFISAVILAGAVGIAFYFAPLEDTALTENVRVAALFDANRGERFSARIYDPEGTAKGIVMVIPPLTDQIRSVDKICAEIRKNGFAVALFLRKNLSLKEKFAVLNAMENATERLTANTAGKYWENERLADSTFLFSRRGDLARDEWGDWEKLPVFGIGYGAGGSALAELAGSPDFLEKNPFLTAFIAIESRFWSSFDYKPEILALPENASRFRAFQLKTAFLFAGLFPKKVTQTKESPKSERPCLFLVSDRVTDARERDHTYIATLKTLHNAHKTSALAAITGAGYLDYSTYPAIQPLFFALTKGKTERIWKKSEYIVHVSALMIGFAEIFLGNAENSLEKKKEFEKLLENSRFEKNDYWDLGEL